MEAHTRWIGALAALGMVGFVGTCVATMMGALGAVAHVALTSAALAAYYLGLAAARFAVPDGTHGRSRGEHRVPSAAAKLDVRR